jgi:hypothetical protein
MVEEVPSVLFMWVLDTLTQSLMAGEAIVGRGGDQHRTGEIR